VLRHLGGAFGDAFNVHAHYCSGEKPYRTEHGKPAADTAGTLSIL